MSDPAETCVRVFASAMDNADVLEAKTTDVVSALLALAAALAEEAGACRAGFVAAAGRAYDVGHDRVCAALADRN